MESLADSHGLLPQVGTVVAEEDSSARATKKNGGCVYRDKLTRSLAPGTTVLSFYTTHHPHFSASIWRLRIRSGTPPPQNFSSSFFKAATQE
jgi:hypothetical protein